MPNSYDYWKKRTLESEAKAQRLAGKEMKRQAALYKQAYKDISSSIDALAAQIEIGYTPTRSELWQYKKYLDLQKNISQTLNGLGNKQVSMTEDLLNKVFEDTIGKSPDDIDKGDADYTVQDKYQQLKALNENWSGKNYSNRIHENTNALAQRIKNDVTDMVVNGKSPTEIKHGLMTDLNMGYNYADRLVRTESSHIYNEASLDRYKNANVQKVRIIGNDDEAQCDICAQYIDQEYDINSVPKLPTHPNCRCCYAPIVDLGVDL